MNRKRGVNGERTLSLSFLNNEINADFLPNLDFNWKTEFDGDKYTLINPSIEAITKGKSLSAIHQFFTDFGGHYLQDEVEDQSRTALDAYTQLFQDTGYTVNLVDNFYAATLNYQKNQSKAERFHYYNERFKAEFIVSGNTVYLYNKIGSYKPDVRIDEDLNVKSAKVTKDTGSFWTWCKCYYDKVDSTEGTEEEYQQEKVYQNKELIAIYGEIEGPALYQGNIKYENIMLEYAAAQQQNSYSVSHEVSLVDLRRQGYEEFIFNEGDTVRLSLGSINQTVDIRIIEINETFVEDEYGDMQLVDFSLTLGNEGVVQAYKNSKNHTMLDLQDWLEGRREMPPNILPAAIRQAADIILGDTDSVMEYRKDRMIGHHSKNEGNNITVNASGLVLFRDGEPKTAISYLGIVADTVTTGTLNTNYVKVQGSEGLLLIDGDMMRVVDGSDWDQYTLIEDGNVEARGKYRRTWKGVTKTHDTSLRLENGYFRARNNNEQYSIYYSDYGISTYADAEGNDDASGSLLFRETEYSDTWGVTLHSTYGAVALKSEYSTVHLDADNTVNLESRSYSVYVRPFKNTRNGLNEFQFYVKENESSSDTDGALLYGNITGGATHGSGIRFSKNSSEAKVYITDVKGDIGTGGLHAKSVQAESIRVLNEGANLYLGTSTGEVRVTNNLLYNGGDIGYKPIKASAFTQASSEIYKTNIANVGDVGLDTIMGLNVVEYNLIDDIEEGITDNRQIGLIAEDSAPVATKDLTGIDLYKMSSYNIKAVQELVKRVEKLEGLHERADATRDGQSE